MDLSPYIGSGTVTYDRQWVEPGKFVIEQTWALDEDLLQVEYPEDYVVDLGWYPSYDFNGGFVLKVVLGCNWDEPPLEVVFRGARFIPGLLRLSSGFVQWLTEAHDGTLHPAGLDGILGTGAITYQRQGLDFQDSADKQLGGSGGDLLQVRYPDGYTVGLWWLPECLQGLLHKPGFAVLVARNSDWDRPLVTFDCADTRHIPKLLDLCSVFIGSIIGGPNAS